MVYGFPETAQDFDEVNAYERLREEVDGYIDAIAAYAELQQKYEEFHRFQRAQ